MLVMAPYTNMPDDVKAMAKDTEARSRQASCIPSRARSTSRTAREAIGDGKNLDDGTLLGMNWYVKGIDDKVPQ